MNTVRIIPTAVLNRTAAFRYGIPLIWKYITSYTNQALITILSACFGLITAGSIASANNLALSVSELGTDFTSAGVGGLRNVGSGVLNLTNVNGSVKRALLYWHGPTNTTNLNANANITFAGQSITGTNIGLSDDNCWGFQNSHAYRADVTAIVHGNGTYTISGLLQNNANANGASLLVFYDDGDSTNNRDIFLFEGNDSNINNSYDAPGWNITLAPINFHGGTAAMELHVADGQSFLDAAVIGNGSTIAPSGAIFQGTSVPSANNGPTGNGSLWDIRRFDVASLLSLGLNTLNVTTGVRSDCLSAVVIVIDVPTDSVVAQPGDRELFGILDPNYPTIVLTHGLQDEKLLENGQVDPDKLWTGLKEKQALTLIDNFLGTKADNINIVQYVWREAFQPEGCVLGLPTAEGYIAAQRNVKDAGVRLAHLLFDALGPDYDKPIHFIGHSLGTAVNAHAANTLLNALAKVELTQFTALDRPHHIREVRISGVLVRGICGLTTEQETLYGYDSDIFIAMLPFSKPGLDLRIDNYYAREDAGVGDRQNGARVYNHINDDIGLDNPNNVGGKYFEEETTIFTFGADNNHSGVHQWYRWTIDPNADVFTRENLFNSLNCENGQWNNPPSALENEQPTSLDPCQKGWDWALIRDPENPNFDNWPGFNGKEVRRSPQEPVLITAHEAFGCRIEPENPQPDDLITVICGENSSPFIVLDVFIPDESSYIAFEYTFTNIGDGDYAAVLLDDNPIWVLSGSSVLQPGEFADSGPIPIGDLKGDRRLTVVLYGVGEPNAEVILRNFSTLGVSLAGDLDGDGNVDRDDLDLILMARNTPAADPNDPRDLDGDGMITVLDARKLTLLCTLPRCAVQ